MPPSIDASEAKSPPLAIMSSVWRRVKSEAKYSSSSQASFCGEIGFLVIILSFRAEREGQEMAAGRSPWATWV